MQQRILVATHNRGKVAELSDILSDMAITWLTLEDAGITFDVEETGETLADNAILKATTYAQETGLLTLADDSGLEVDALDGRPGVYTARFGQPGFTPEQRYLYLLSQMSDVPWEARTARFRCVVALATPEGLLATAEGTCEGHITFEPAGTGGFGYDPVFFVSEKGMTMAELPAEEKHAISHRGRAMAQMAPLLRRHVQGGE